MSGGIFFIEAQLDEEEGADILMVKPAMFGAPRKQKRMGRGGYTPRKFIYIYIPAPSKGCQLNPKGW